MEPGGTPPFRFGRPRTADLRRRSREGRVTRKNRDFLGYPASSW
ncbi:hypothetical protein APASM_6988 [Actinosynnema pretiosum subsp. pretiosum]|nr:hypothetical protein APASM_6988 [Actinosynnema pretiosum subsp. pretiosum]